MLITKTRCAFRKHYVTGSILFSTLFTLISIIVVVALGVKLAHHPDDIVEWILVIAAIPFIRAEVSHYKEITHHLIRKSKGTLGSNTVHLNHKNCKSHEASKLTRLRKKHYKV